MRLPRIGIGALVQLRLRKYLEQGCFADLGQADDAGFHELPKDEMELEQKYSYCNASAPFGRLFSPGKNLLGHSPAHDTNCTSALISRFYQRITYSILLKATHGNNEPCP